MIKLILLATVAIAALIYQPANAQVSLNVNIGTRPNYYAPAPQYVYVDQPRYIRPAYYPTRTVVVAQPRYYARPRVYRSNYRSYHVTKFKGGKPHKGHGHGHGRGR
jgi:hypothetical protein